MSTLNLNPWIDANPVQQRFILSRDFEVCLLSPRGEGKTEAGIRRMFLMSASQPPECRPIPWAIVRDTWRNLERTTLQSFLAPHPGSFAEKIRPFLKVGERGEKLSFPGLWTATLIGVDSLGDLNRFQSMQLGGLWLEEPSPAVQEVGGGLDERVLTIGISSMRYPCEWRTVQITSNYPDESHWVWQRYGVKRLGTLFEIPRGENPHLPPDYRQRMEEGLAGDPGLLDRLVYGRPGFVCQGEKVTPGYNPEVHRATRELEPYPGLIGYRFWDGGLNPACVVGQMMPSGQFHVLEVFAGRRMGMLQLVREFVAPAMRERYRCITVWEDIGDPAIANREQSNFDWQNTAAAIIERELDTYFQPGERLWEPRQEALQTAFAIVEPFPLILLSAGPRTEILDRALRGGWHYRRLPSGVVSGRIPVKDAYSHVGDALSYGVPRILELHRLMMAEKSESAEEVYRVVGEALGGLPWFGTGRSPITGY